MKDIVTFINESKYGWIDPLLKNITDELKDFLKGIKNPNPEEEVTFESDKEPIAIDFYFKKNGNKIELDETGGESPIGYIDYDMTGKGGSNALYELEGAIAVLAKKLLNEIN